jgi:hypothetical protein
VSCGVGRRLPGIPDAGRAPGSIHESITETPVHRWLRWRIGASAATASPCVAAALQLTSRQASRLPRRSTARQQSGADTASCARCRGQVYLRIQRATGQGCCSARVENSDRRAPIAGAAAALAGRRRRPRPLLTSLPARPSQVFQSSSAATTRAGRTCQHRGLQRTVRFSEADAGGFRFLTYAGPAVEVM